MEKTQNWLGTLNLNTDFVWENRIFVWENRIFVWEKSKNCLGDMNLLATGNVVWEIIEKLSGRIEILSVSKKIAGHQ